MQARYGSLEARGYCEVVQTQALIVCIALAAALSGCTDEDGIRLIADDPADPTSPTFEPSEVVRETFVSDAEPYCPPGRDNCCPTWLTDYGTDMSIEDVVAFFEGLGFKGSGATVDERSSPAPGGRLVRWAGSRGSGLTGWRKVDIALGSMAGRDDWATVVELFAPACSEGAADPSVASPASAGS